MEATLLILDLLNLPSQAPQHAKLITVMEDEALPPHHKAVMPSLQVHQTQIYGLLYQSLHKV